MPEYISIGHKISVAALRDFLFTKRVEKGDSIVLNAHDFEHLAEEIKASGGHIDVPLNLFGVLLVKDTAGNIPPGKIHLVEDDKM